MLFHVCVLCALFTIQVVKYSFCTLCIINSINLLTLNVRDLRDKTKRFRILNYLEQIDADVIISQEAHVVESDLEEWKKDFGRGHIYINPLDTKSSGQIIILKENREIISHE